MKIKSNWTVIYAIIFLLVLIAGVVIFKDLNKPEPTLTLVLLSEQNISHSGSASLVNCTKDADCIASGCNGNICQGTSEQSPSTICSVPKEPTPKTLNYSCGCAKSQCQWYKSE